MSEADALKHVAGYVQSSTTSPNANTQLRAAGGTWDKGKGCDTFGPVGPWLVTADEVPDPQALGAVAGPERPALPETAARRRWSSAWLSLVSYISRFMTLHPGDLISTGSRPAWAWAASHRATCRPGDEMRLGIAGLGEQHQRVHAWDPALIDG